jgi:uncharacterized protein YndB with AHSA1/START domain
MKWVLIAAGGLASIVAVIAVVGAFVPRSHVASRTAHLKQRPDSVWQTIADYANAASWRSDVKSVERLPDREGRAVWQEIDSHGQRLPLETLEEIPPRRLVRRIADPTLPFGGTWTIEIEPTGAGCAVTITERGEIKNAVFRFVAHYLMGYTATIESYLKALARKFGEDAVIS